MASAKDCFIPLIIQAAAKDLRTQWIRSTIGLMSLERFTATSAEQLADDLTAFVYSRDRSFATGKTDVSRHIAIRERRVTAGDDSSDVLELSNKERLDLKSSRNLYIPDKRRNASRPSDFVIVYRQMNQLDGIPLQLRHVLTADLLDHYDGEPGDLNEVHEVEYGVTLEPDGEVFVGRDIKYRLRDIKEVIYKASESKQPQTKQVYVATEGDHMQVRTAVFPEMIEDLGEQVQVGVDFFMYTRDESANMEQKIWLDVEIADQVACINAIMNSFTTGRPVSRAV